MDEQEKQQAAQALRQELRNVRRSQPSTRQTSGSAESHSESPGGQGRPTGGPFIGNPSQTRRDTASARSNNRSTQGLSERERSDGGRLEYYDGSVTERSDQAAKYHGLERVDASIERTEKRPVGRPRKEQIVDAAVEVKKTLFKKRAPLTEKEAEGYRDPLIHAIQSYGEYADKYIRWKSQEIPMDDIWGNITDFEAGALANILLRRGMKNAQAAEVVRSMVNGEDYVSVGVMFIPRIIATTEQLKKAPPKPRKPRKER